MYQLLNIRCTSREAYEEIIRNNLYEFPAKKPENVVNSIVRRHCFGLDFPTAHPVKYFKIVGYRGKKPLYSLMDIGQTISAVSKNTFTDGETLPEEKIQKFYDEHLENIYSQLIDTIMSKLPEFLRASLWICY